MSMSVLIGESIHSGLYIDFWFNYNFLSISNKDI